jgi:RimJ/RimL family protein N-acetyltransferase
MTPRAGKLAFGLQPILTALPDGTPLLFRPIRADDKADLADAFERLSPRARYLRFLTAMRSLSEEQLRYLTEVDFRRHVAWVAVLPEQPDHPGVGVARWVRDAEDPSQAEMAVAVLDEYQGRGVGRALLRLLMRSAIELGVRTLTALVNPENQPMLALLREAGASGGGYAAGAVQLRLQLPADMEELERRAAPALLRSGRPAPLPRAGPPRSRRRSR